MEPTTNTHIESRSNRDGQVRAFVAGTRIKVQNVYVLSELQGKSPDEIVAAYPNLTLAQVHAALSYYFDHMNEIHAEFQQDADFIQQLRANTGPGPNGTVVSKSCAPRDLVDAPQRYVSHCLVTGVSYVFGAGDTYVSPLLSASAHFQPQSREAILDF